MRARAFVADAMGLDTAGVDVPVIGGHAGETILPLLSQSTPPFTFTDAEAAALTNRIQNAGTEARAASRLAIRRPQLACARWRRLSCACERLAGGGGQGRRGQRDAQYGAYPPHSVSGQPRAGRRAAAAAGAGGRQAAAAAEFAECCARAKLGEPGVVVCAYVASHLTEQPYFASRLLLGRQGVAEFLPLGPMSAGERAGLAKMMPELKASIDKGVAFANK